MTQSEEVAQEPENNEFFSAMFSAVEGQICGVEGCPYDGCTLVAVAYTREALHLLECWNRATVSRTPAGEEVAV